MSLSEFHREVTDVFGRLPSKAVLPGFRARCRKERVVTQPILMSLVDQVLRGQSALLSNDGRR
jgi:hypothetical protein